MSVRSFVRAMAAVVALGVTAAGAEDGISPYRLQIYFVQGHNTASLIGFEDTEVFRTPLRQLFTPHAVEFRQEAPTRGELLAMLRKADVFYTNSHAGIVGGSHILEVRPSADNRNITPKEKRSYTTAGEIRGVFPNAEAGPRLVIVNGCSMTNPDDGVAGANRISGAVGIGEDTEGRAFVGWGEKIVGHKGDSYFREFLSHWAKYRERGPYPTLEETRQALGNKAVEGFSAASLSIVGDKELRFDHMAGYVGEHNILGKWQMAGLVEKRGNMEKEVDLGPFRGLTLHLLRGGAAEVLSPAGQAFPGVPPDALRWRLAEEDGKTVLKIGIRKDARTPRSWYTITAASLDRNRAEVIYRLSDGIQIYELRRAQ